LGSRTVAAADRLPSLPTGMRMVARTGRIDLDAVDESVDDGLIRRVFADRSHSVRARELGFCLGDVDSETELDLARQLASPVAPHIAQIGVQPID
ncbi:hypothetical protein HER21_41910, partial [Pseudomonas sp. BGM005]|nr:hypothetical protein [Pseudomonas sp. BG5]